MTQTKARQIDLEEAIAVRVPSYYDAGWRCRNDEISDARKASRASSDSRCGDGERNGSSPHD
jgi:hypothetical protein